ncbi:OmpH family outer membrane protein [Sneathiella marina]|uniref:OmpH family outer membrane protein n=1 Tax=Sneathiella marina TaxID=2950108 RepID=A0ABY4W5L3_9PROT|nr:OmpH family outer membrane protein [Sneathiella marina]USG62328.1 OmpH family outer membrane protein [Sneathiella marina]
MVNIFRNAILGFCAFAIVISYQIERAGFSAALAETKLPEAIIAVVDISYILKHSKPTKAAEAEIEEKLKTVDEDLKKRSADLKKEKEQLDKQRAIISPDAYKKKLEKLNITHQNLQRESQILRGKFNQVIQRVRLHLRELIIVQAAAVSKEKGVNVGIDRAKTVFFDNQMDITEEVLERFNKSNPKNIKITIDENPPAAEKKKN